MFAFIHQLMDPYHLGYKAYYMHGPDAVNPFMKDTKDYEEWKRGYRDSIGDREIAKSHRTIYNKVKRQ